MTEFTNQLWEEFGYDKMEIVKEKVLTTDVKINGIYILTKSFMESSFEEEVIDLIQQDTEFKKVLNGRKISHWKISYGMRFVDFVTE